MLHESSVSRAAAEDRVKWLALAAVATVVAIWGFSGIAIKLTSTTGMVASFYRLWFAIPLLWSVVAVAPSLRRRLDRRWLGACLVGGAFFGLHQFFFFTSIKFTSVANVTIIGALQPALVLLFVGRMFNEQVPLSAVAWSSVALGGTVLVVIGSAQTPAWSPRGDVLAVANLLAFTAYFLASKRVRLWVGAAEYVVGMTTVAGLVVLAGCLATGQELLAPKGRDWAILLFLAVFPGTLGHVLMNWSHRHVPAFVISVMLLATPVIASLGAVVLLDEPLGAVQISGGSLVLIALGVVVRASRRASGEFESAAPTGPRRVS